MVEEEESILTTRMIAVQADMRTMILTMTTTIMMITMIMMMMTIMKMMKMTTVVVIRQCSAGVIHLSTAE